MLIGLSQLSEKSKFGGEFITTQCRGGYQPPARYRLSKRYSSRRIRTTSRLFRRGAHRGRPRGTRPKDNKCWANSLPFSPFLVEAEPIGIATRRAPRMGAPTNRRNLFPFNQTSKMFQVAGICSLPYSWRVHRITPINNNLSAR